MFRGQYDNDVTVWSPQGRLFQVEYAMEAVGLGTACVGLKSQELAVVVGLYKPENQTGLSQPKIIPIDRHVGICIAGITADARVLGKYLRTECLTYRHSYNAPYPISRLVWNLGNKMQISTQRYDRRPHGVGLLLAAYDKNGSHIYQVMPSANVFNCKAMAIGNRSQGAHTYLMKHADTFPYCTNDELICHGIQAISYAASIDEPLKLSIGIVGKDQPFKILSNAESLSYQRTCKPPDDARNHDMSWYPEALKEFEFTENDDAGPSDQGNAPTSQPSHSDVTPVTSGNQINDNKSS
ncbi:proteasome subunit alpha type-1-like [Drosophila hydei]|uniref:Proteasome subunit alpha type n=1 Tax=Drosophila hydei TaxID=7224 RepID=A0A6J1LIJ1_DROHY|nr:proteasome subunit alpha type-1-like [Drosophila hydei]